MLHFITLYYDVGQELTKYDECAAFSEAKLRTAFDDIDVLQNKVDTAYNVLLDAALSPPSSRLKRCKENLDTRIAELMNLLSNNAACTRHEQGSQCVTLETYESKSGVIVNAKECNDNDSILIDDAGVQSYNTPVLLLTVSILLTFVIDSKQPCFKKPDPSDDLIVEPDKYLQKEQYSVPGVITEHTLNTDKNMIMMCIADCSATEADDHVCESRVTNGLKHRWRWKQYELLYRTDPGIDLRTVL